MDRIKLIEEFKNKTGMDFFSANETFYWSLPEDMTEHIVLTQKDIHTSSDDDFKKLYDLIFSLAFKKENVRKSIDTKKVDAFYVDSVYRCIGSKRRDTTSTDFLVASSLINEDTIKNVLVKNPGICFNPLFLMNDGYGGDTCPLVFKPSTKLVRRLKFITPLYSGTHLKGYDIDIKYLKQYERFIIYEDDILGLYLGMYHPYIWGIIQNDNLSLLIHSI